MSDKHIDSRLPVDTEVEPIDIKEEYYKDIEELTNTSDQLGQLRAEMGRLFQILGNMREKSNSVEREMMEKRQALIEAHGITTGQWVLDSAKKQIVKIEKGAPLTP